MQEILIKTLDNGYTVTVADTRFMPPGGTPNIQNRVFTDYASLMAFLKENIPEKNG